MKNGVVAFLLSILILTCVWLPVSAQQTTCTIQSFEVIMATPFSSRINRKGDALQAILVRPVHLNSGMILRSGAKLTGYVTDVKSSANSTHTATGRIRVQFTDATGQNDVNFIPATEDGWLHQADANSAVWKVAADRSTRLLNMMLRRRLGYNRAVWAQILGIRENVIPNPDTDEFIYNYHQRDVLVGAGDHLTLRTVCPE